MNSKNNNDVPNDENIDGKTNQQQKDYWQEYSKTKKRVYGMLSLEEHAEFAARAEENDCSVFEQIRRESNAYATKITLPDHQLHDNMQKLIISLRSIATGLHEIERAIREEGGDIASHSKQITERLMLVEKEMEHFIQQSKNNNNP